MDKQIDVDGIRKYLLVKAEEMIPPVNLGVGNFVNYVVEVIQSAEQKARDDERERILKEFTEKAEDYTSVRDNVQTLKEIIKGKDNPKG